MKIVFFSHPDFLGHKSMSRFTNMLAAGMKKRGHTIDVLSPTPRFVNIHGFQQIRKWLGYIDQYLLFPLEVKRRLKRYSKDTLFVFTDHALGPWVPLVVNRFHVIHCHDFLAQLSASGEIIEHSTRWLGRQYQAYIQRGFTKGKHFISVSENTRKDLQKFKLSSSHKSYMVYNGLNNVFAPCNLDEARMLFSGKLKLDLSDGYILHVGGNQWYKNRLGVIDIYDAWRSMRSYSLPLVMIGENPSSNLFERCQQSSFKKDIHFLTMVEDEFVRLAYSGASLLLFPSIAEGFGWPIAEAMASGCPVVTTNEPPMTEVAGKAGIFISKRPNDKSGIKKWALDSATVINQTLLLTRDERKVLVTAGIENAKRFDTDNALADIENIYLKVLEA